MESGFASPFAPKVIGTLTPFIPFPTLSKFQEFILPENVEQTLALRYLMIDYVRHKFYMIKTIRIACERRKITFSRRTINIVSRLVAETIGISSLEKMDPYMEISEIISFNQKNVKNLNIFQVLAEEIKRTEGHVPRRDSRALKLFDHAISIVLEVLPVEDKTLSFEQIEQGYTKACVNMIRLVMLFLVTWMLVPSPIHSLKSSFVNADGSGGLQVLSTLKGLMDEPMYDKSTNAIKLTLNQLKLKACYFVIEDNILAVRQKLAVEDIARKYLAKDLPIIYDMIKSKLNNIDHFISSCYPKEHISIESQFVWEVQILKKTPDMNGLFICVSNEDLLDVVFEAKEIQDVIENLIKICVTDKVTHKIKQMKHHEKEAKKRKRAEEEEIQRQKLRKKLLPEVEEREKKKQLDELQQLLESMNEHGPMLETLEELHEGEEEEEEVVETSTTTTSSNINEGKQEMSQMLKKFKELELENLV
jgi:hypothetical protein